MLLLERVKKCECCSLVLYNLVYFGMHILILIAHLTQDSVTTSSSSVGSTLDYIVSNLGSNPILNITPTVNLKCPNGYELFQIGTWPGTSPGCYCSSSDKLTPGFCSEYSSCLNISSISPLPYYR